MEAYFIPALDMQDRCLPKVGGERASDDVLAECMGAVGTVKLSEPKHAAKLLKAQRSSKGNR